MSVTIKPFKRAPFSLERIDMLNKTIFAKTPLSNAQYSAFLPWMPKKVIFFLSPIVLLVLALAIWKLPSLEKSRNPKSAPAPTVRQAEKSEFLKELQEQLTNSGWKNQAAEAVVNLQKNKYLELYKICGKVDGNEIKILQNLHPTGSVDRIIQKHPMAASLFTLINDPEPLAKTLLKRRRPEAVKNLLATFAMTTYTNEDNAWSKIITRFPDQITTLSERSLDPNYKNFIYTIFMYLGSGTHNIPEYDHWLKTIFHPKNLSPSNKEVESLMSFVVLQGENIRRRMDQEKVFRYDFQNQLWRDFKSYVHNTSEQAGLKFAAYSLLGQDPALWDLLSSNNGKELLQKNGDLAIDRLVGEERLPPELRPRVRSLLLNGNTKIVENLFTGSWVNDAQFINLLQNKNISDANLLKIGTKLANAGGNYQPLLAKWSRIESASALSDELGPAPSGLKTFIPGWGIYYSCVKLSQGRGLNVDDALSLTGDAFFFVPAVKGAKIVTVAGKTAAKKATGEVIELTVKKTVKENITRIAKVANQRANRVISKEGLDITKGVKGAFKLTRNICGNRESLKN